MKNVIYELIFVSNRTNEEFLRIDNSPIIPFKKGDIFDASFLDFDLDEQIRLLKEHSEKQYVEFDEFIKEYRMFYLGKSLIKNVKNSLKISIINDCVVVSVEYRVNSIN
jgi:hypothetical protein